jgi:S-disulfanyl-L-cysteine oxidoreductase SoxD
LAVCADILQLHPARNAVQRSQSLTAEQTYAVCAYIRYLNQIVPADAVMDAETLPEVQMPNRNGFTSPDPRSDVHDRPAP